MRELTWKILLAVSLSILVPLSGNVIAADKVKDGDQSSAFLSRQMSHPVKGVVLQGTSTLIFSTQSNPTAANGGEAFQCEGDPEGDYQCSNSIATYGCSEACKCCYYEENYIKVEDNDFKAMAP
jgi:hypothetical protein